MDRLRKNDYEVVQEDVQRKPSDVHLDGEMMDYGM
jgi:hypothetical protein